MPQKIYSSPLRRCTKLASVFSSHFIIDERLREINFGNWEMKKWDTIDPIQLDAWMKDFVHIPCPNGDKYLDIYDNAVSFFDEIRTSENDQSNECIFVISHAGIIRSLVSYVLDYPLEHSFRFEFDTGSVTQLVSDHNIFKIRFLNR